MAEQEITRLVLERYSPRAKSLIFDCQALADGAQHAEVTPLHLLSECLSLGATVEEVFRRASVSLTDLSAAVQSELARQPLARESSCLSALLLELMSRAERDALRAPQDQVGVEHLLQALSHEVRGAAGEILGAFGMGPGALQPHEQDPRARPSTLRTSVVVPSAVTPTFPYTVSFSAMPVAEAGPLVGRVAELERLQVILQRRTKNHPLLVGNVGVGKATIVRGLAQHWQSPEGRERAQGLRLTRLDVASLVAGSRVRGELEGRVRQVLDSVAEHPGTVLVVVGVEQIYSPGSALVGLGDLLRAAVERQGLRLLCTTTVDGEQRIRERDTLLHAMMTRLPVAEPSCTEALEIVQGVAPLYENHHGVKIGAEAINTAVQLAKRYLPERSLPDSALDLLDETAAGSGRGGGYGSDLGPLSSEAVAQTLAQWTGVPVARMLEAEADKLSQMEARLRRQVVGQDDALEKIARAVRRSRVGLRNPRRPIGSFLFMGPTGVGKTELAKALAQFLFDDEQALTRLDMSEYMERHMAQRLLGAPPGYADSDQGGLLTEAVRARPYSVLLFDEVEKAHQDVFNLLLQVLDEGRLTDGRGRVADFSHTVVILTSNLGAGDSAHSGGNSPEQALSAFFRPEFLNRIDDVVLFRPLSREDLLAIVDISLNQVRRMLEARGLGLEVSIEAKKRLVDLGYQPALGARPLQRAVVRQLQDPIAEGLLSGQFESGRCIHVSLQLESEGGPQSGYLRVESM